MRSPGQEIINRGSDNAPMLTLIASGQAGLLGAIASTISLYGPRNFINHVIPHFWYFQDHLPLNVHLAMPAFALSTYIVDSIVSSLWVGSQVGRVQNKGLFTYHSEANPIHAGASSATDLAQSMKDNWYRDLILHGGFVLGSALFPPLGIFYGVTKLGATASNLAVGTRYARAVAAENRR